jgi:1-acyl-sn-glycerol-3-phosphate acyltransferase
MLYDPDTLDRRSPEFITRLLPAMEWFNTRYLKLRHEGGEQIPSGPVMFVANHNGGIMGPDLMCTLPVLWRRLGAASPLYALAHDFAMRQFTPLGKMLQRVGAIRACRDNARRVLGSGGQILVYPGGDLDAYRSFKRRNEVCIVPRSGFVQVARELEVPIVPVVAHGAHRSAYIFTEGEGIARLLRLQKWARLERFPLALALPWGVALGPWLPYMPLPFPIKLRLLPPVRVAKEEASEAAAARIQGLMQNALDEMAR